MVTIAANILFFFQLTRHMSYENSVIEATLGVHENPIHEIIINEHYKHDNAFCDGLVIKSTPLAVDRRKRKGKQ